jgi:hypothetical protein
MACAAITPPAWLSPASRRDPPKTNSRGSSIQTGFTLRKIGLQKPCWVGLLTLQLSSAFAPHAASFCFCGEDFLPLSAPLR